MVMQQWVPFTEMRRAQENMRRWRTSFGGNGDSEVGGWGASLDVAREGDNYIIQVSLPGVGPDNIDVTVEDNVLTIKANTQSEHDNKEGEYLIRERQVGSFHRSLRLPDTVDTESINPSYKDGVLTITIPKAESKKAKHLKVLAN